MLINSQKPQNNEYMVIERSRLTVNCWCELNYVQVGGR